MCFIYSHFFFIFTSWPIFLKFTLHQETLITTSHSTWEKRNNSQKKTFETKCKTLHWGTKNIYKAQIWLPKDFSQRYEKMSVLYFQRNQIRHGPWITVWMQTAFGFDLSCWKLWPIYPVNAKPSENVFKSVFPYQDSALHFFLFHVP